jgi:hypothetical protein
MGFSFQTSLRQDNADTDLFETRQRPGRNMAGTASGWREWWAEGAREQLGPAELDSAEKLWILDLPAVDAPNLGRGGRSWVVRLELPGGVGGYLKRQEGHLCRSPRRFLRRLPTALREFEALRRLARAGLPAARPLVFARRGDQALLLTREIEAMGSLDEVMPALSGRPRAGLVRELALLVRRIHDLGQRHGSLYPKHLLVTSIEPPAFGLIDLEKSRPVLLRFRAQLRDLDQLSRRAGPEFSRADRWRFLRAYVDGDEELLWRLRSALGQLALRRPS